LNYESGTKLSLEELKMRNLPPQDQLPISPPLSNAYLLKSEDLDELFSLIISQQDQSDKIPVPQHADSVEFIADTGTTDSDQDTTNPDSTDIITGWEAERAFLFSAENQTVANSLVTNVSFGYSHSAMLINNLVQLGAAVERSANTAPIINGATNLQPPKAKERKLAPEQKEDDHSGYEMKL